MLLKYLIYFKSIFKNSSAKGHIGAEYYGDLVYLFIRIVGKPNLSHHFKMITKSYKKSCV